MDATICANSITQGIREFGTYDPFDKSYAMDFVNSPKWSTMSAEDASTFTAESMQIVKGWMLKCNYTEQEADEIIRYFIEHFAMDWDESVEGSKEDYQTFCHHDSRIMEMHPRIINGY